MTEQTSHQTPTPEVSEIQLSEIIGFIKKYFMKTGFAALVFGALGYGLSFTRPISFKATSTILPESVTSNGLGSFASLARLSGISRNESGGAIQPELYPTIFTTVPFALHLLKQPVVDQENRRFATVKEFLHRNKEKDGEPDTDSSSSATAPRVGKNIISLSKAEYTDTKKAMSLIDAQYDQKTGVITIDCEAPDPVVAAQLVENASDYLIKYISDYRLEKTIREVTFLSEQVTEMKKRQGAAEYALQSYRDRNRSQFLNVARIEEQRLQADYLLSQSLYSDMVRKWEEAKIKVKEEQPIIKVLSPPQIPLKRFKPVRATFALAFACAGVVIFLLYVVFVVEKYHKRF